MELKKLNKIILFLMIVFIVEVLYVNGYLFEWYYKLLLSCISHDNNYYMLIDLMLNDLYVKHLILNQAENKMYLNYTDPESQHFYGFGSKFRYRSWYWHDTEFSLELEKLNIIAEYILCLDNSSVEQMNQTGLNMSKSSNMNSVELLDLNNLIVGVGREDMEEYWIYDMSSKQWLICFFDETFNLDPICEYWDRNHNVEYSYDVIEHLNYIFVGTEGLEKLEKFFYCEMDEKYPLHYDYNQKRFYFFCEEDEDEDEDEAWLYYDHKSLGVSEYYGGIYANESEWFLENYDDKWIILLSNVKYPMFYMSIVWVIFLLLKIKSKLGIIYSKLLRDIKVYRRLM